MSDTPRSFDNPLDYAPYTLRERPSGSPESKHFAVRECEAAVFADDGRLLSEAEHFAEQAGLCCDCQREHFEHGWQTAMYGWPPPDMKGFTPRRLRESDRIRRMGFDTYRRARGLPALNEFGEEII